jgi:hypothetical protein
MDVYLALYSRLDKERRTKKVRATKITKNLCIHPSHNMAGYTITHIITGKAVIHIQPNIPRSLIIDAAKRTLNTTAWSACEFNELDCKDSLAQFCICITIGVARLNDRQFEYGYLLEGIKNIIEESHGKNEIQRSSD